MVWVDINENPDEKKRSWVVRENAVKRLMENGCACVSDDRLMQVIREVRREGEQITLTYQGGENWVFGPNPLSEELKVRDD